MAGQIHNNENYVAARFQHKTSYKTRETDIDKSFTLKQQE